MSKLHTVALRYRGGMDFTSLQTSVNKDTRTSEPMIAAFLSNAAQLGYGFTAEAVHLMSESKQASFYKWAPSVLQTLKEERGAQYSYNPMYPNFPKEVAEASDYTLYMNAFLHYFAQYALGRTLLPDTVKEERFPLYEETATTVLNAVHKEDYNEISRNLINAKLSYSEADIAAVTQLLTDDDFKATIRATTIPNKENYATLTNLYRGTTLGLELISNARNATDALRVIAVFSGAHPSLSENFRIGKLTRAERRAIVTMLNNNTDTNAEAFKRDTQKWKRVLERLHIKEYTLTPELNELVRTVRAGENIPTWGTELERALTTANIRASVKILAARPGVFARRLNTLLENADSNEQEYILQQFSKVAAKASTPVLWQALSWTRTRLATYDAAVSYSTLFTKGTSNQAFILPRRPTMLTQDTLAELHLILTKAIGEVYRERPSLGKVYYQHDKEYNPTLPFGLRNTTGSGKTVGRGTRTKFNTDKTLRFFIHWKGYGVDLDLSAAFLDDTFESVGHVSYSNLRNDYSYHSGDIVSAPDGASEFIDINVEQASQKVRYVLMSVKSYSLQPFNKVEECFAGFMTRKDIQNGEIYEPKTVENSFTIHSEGQNVAPLLFDLCTGEAIWLDLGINVKAYHGPNDIISSISELSKAVKGIVEKESIYVHEVLEAHILERATGVAAKPEDADTIIYLNRGDSNNVNLDNIIAEWL